MPTTLSSDESLAFHTDTDPTGAALTPLTRQQIISPYLPAPRPPVSQSKLILPQRPHLRSFLTHVLHFIVFHTLHALFTVYITIRQTTHTLSFLTYSTLYYHHRSSELIRRDVRNIPRVPRHLSVIVDLSPEEGPEALEKLQRDVADVAAWCVCAGIRMLSVYERTGVLKANMSSLDATCRSTMRAYFPPHFAPSIHIRAPLLQFSPGRSRSPSPNAATQSSHFPTNGLDLLLLSATDGRDTLIDLTKTLAEMAQKRKLAPEDITPELIDAEIMESSFAEPDLLVLMTPSASSSLVPRRRKRRRVSKARSGSVDGDNGGIGVAKEGLEATGVVGGGGEICLRGYPPWQVRLTEIFHVRDGRGVEYQAFLRALHRFAKAEMRFGR